MKNFTEFLNESRASVANTTDKGKEIMSNNQKRAGKPVVINGNEMPNSVVLSNKSYVTKTNNEIWIQQVDARQMVRIELSSREATILKGFL